MTVVDAVARTRSVVWTAPRVVWFVPMSAQGLGTTRRTEPQLLHTRGIRRERPGSGLAGLHLDAVGELADLVEDGPALGEQLADLAVGVHHRGVVASAELAPDLG